MVPSLSCATSSRRSSALSSTTDLLVVAEVAFCPESHPRTSQPALGSRIVGRMLGLLSRLVTSPHKRGAGMSRAAGAGRREGHRCGPCVFPLSPGYAWGQTSPSWPVVTSVLSPQVALIRASPLPNKIPPQFRFDHCSPSLCPLCLSFCSGVAPARFRTHRNEPLRNDATGGSERL